MRRLAVVATVVVGLLVLGLGGMAVPAGAAAPATRPPVAAPTITGPVTGGKGSPSLLAAVGDLASVGYVAEEYFLEGTATSYAPKGKLRPDGKWSVKASDTAPYKTRIVVYRPEAAADFDGTVFVEWLNVSSGFDAATDWIMAHTQIIRAHAAWIGVSAQAVGVQGGVESVTDFVAAGGIKASDPERYGTLTHPGDDYSYDIFSQAGVAARNTGKVHVLGPLRVKRTIAIGQSQAAFRLVTYINAIHPMTHAYDGYLVHSRSGNSSGFHTSDQYGFDDPAIPDLVATRTDIDVPVLTFQTETDLERLGYLPATQPDSKHFRLWEVAGAAHADAYVGGAGFGDIDQGDAERALLDPSEASGGPLACAGPINAGPTFMVLNAALFNLERWVRTGTPPEHAPPMVNHGDSIVRDEHGIAKGGIRTPIVDAPIATNDGEGNVGASFCFVFGNTKPFDAATLAALYPTHDDYMQAFDASTSRAVKAGFLMKQDADQLQAAAASLPIPS